MSVGPLDLRLVPAAVAAWLAATVGTRLTARGAVAGLVLALGCGAVVAATVLPGRGRHRSARPPSAGPVVVALAAAAAVLLSCAVQLAARERGPVAAAAARGAVVIAVGTLTAYPVADPAPWAPEVYRVRTRMRLTAVTVGGTTTRTRADVLIVGDGAGLDHPPGTRLRVVGRLAAARGAQSAVLTATSATALRGPPPAQAAVARLRDGLRTATAGLPADARGLVPGSTVGDTSQVAPELADALRAAGLAHLVAVSGQHVAVVVMLALAATGAVRAPRWVRAGAAALAAVAFAVVVGGGAAVLRAVATGAVGAIGLGVGRRAVPLPALAAVVVVLVVVDPWATGTLGFRLSVAATAAIVLLAGPAARALGRTDRTRRWWLAVTVPLAAQSAVGPVLALVDPVVTPWAVPANLVAAPAVVPVTVLGLVTLLLGPVAPAPAGAVAAVAAIPATWIATVARVVATLPGARTPWHGGPGGAVALAALTGAAWCAGRALLAERGRRRR
ncbi:ComEC/Rec2 family competence protein [Isoptericola sp. b490]|uniref:ComEC/Rec2 family competence protein n=1 Tax=Actinotalea lenta TaxID=3064654 RepID=UPI002713A3B3|nr:ComEC/Rec2 family competence protein [Isoptericola sp. b490]MDO8120199.1 ComEC/Rec2 family competence protein [Isoptericola sp. b490]